MADKLLQILAVDFLDKITNHSGLAIFGANRAKFEGWLKVELIDILSKKGFNPTPEFETVDINCDLGAIELKTINTNYNYPNVTQKGKPITKNIDSVVNDINKLRLRTFSNKYVAFLVFPLEHNNLTWDQHYRKISKELASIVNVSFNFSNGIPGVFYCGKI